MTGIWFMGRRLVVMEEIDLFYTFSRQHCRPVQKFSEIIERGEAEGTTTPEGLYTTDVVLPTSELEALIL